MADGLLDDTALAWVDDAHLLVFAHGDEARAVPVPAGRVDQVRVAVDDQRRFRRGHVPHHHHVVPACVAPRKIAEIATVSNEGCD